MSWLKPKPSQQMPVRNLAVDVSNSTTNLGAGEAMEGRELEVMGQWVQADKEVLAVGEWGDGCI